MLHWYWTPKIKGIYHNAQYFGGKKILPLKYFFCSMTCMSISWTNLKTIDLLSDFSYRSKICDTMVVRFYLLFDMKPNLGKQFGDFGLSSFSLYDYKIAAWGPYQNDCWVNRSAPIRILESICALLHYISLTKLFWMHHCVWVHLRIHTHTNTHIQRGAPTGLIDVCAQLAVIHGFLTVRVVLLMNDLEGPKA